jgi:hypothetical protein
VLGLAGGFYIYCSLKYYGPRGHVYYFDLRRAGFWEVDIHGVAGGEACFCRAELVCYYGGGRGGNRKKQKK